VAFKLYPAGATTNSDAGVTDLRATYSVLEAMQNKAWCSACTVKSPTAMIDVFDREKAFIDTKLIPLRKRFSLS
jgi:dihydroorotase